MNMKENKIGDNSQTTETMITSEQNCRQQPYKGSHEYIRKKNADNIQTTETMNKQEKELQTTAC
jgi:hypothetical protein